MASKLLSLGRIRAQVAERKIIPHQARRYLNEDLKKKQQHFQLDTDTPVYLKGGFGDKILVQITAVLCVVGIADGFHMIYQMVFGKKKN